MAADQPHPGDLSLADFRRVGADVIEAIARYHAGLDERRVLPDSSPAQVAARFTEALPEAGLSAETILDDWSERVLPLLTAVGSPRHFGFVNGSGSMIGIFADALAASVNTNAGGWKLGPAAAEVERQSLRWIAELIGYPVDSGGLVVSGGTMANFTALLAALRHVAPYDTTPTGLQNPDRTGRFLLYMSDHEGHVSITRAADMLNLGRDAVRRVPSHPDFTMDVDALARLIEADTANGDIPFCVVAQLGSINVGAVDPVDRIADVCAAHGLWLHGDGACGLLAACLPGTSALFKGLSRADSVSFDPHKWLGVPYDCGVVMVRDAERLRRAFSITAPYLRGSETDDRVGHDFFEYGPEMSRGFKALKLWMTLRFYGAQGLRAALGNGLELARHLHGLVREHPDFEVVHEPILYIYCFRYSPAALRKRAEEPAAQERLDRLNQEIAETMQKSGLALVMTSRIRGRVVLRMSICSHRTEKHDIERTFEGLAKIGRELEDLETVDPYDLDRFVKAQADDHDQALAEIRAGRKVSHWMWYIFPQFNGLGTSPTSRRYAIRSVAEAEAYLHHPVLGPRLAECVEAVLGIRGRSAHDIFGSPDDMKLHSCATLFARVSPAGSIFQQLLDRYFQGQPDRKTVELVDNVGT